MNSWILVIEVSALFGCALVGGIFFAFSSFVMKALGRIPDPAGMHAMQSINIVVLNPLFLGLFCGTALLSVILVVNGIATTTSPWLIAGGLSYFLGTFLVTALGNVPLNNRLATASPSDPAGHATWQSYLPRWTFLNHLRTAAAILAAFCVLMGLLPA
ncbi:DUF1772 domain-containing protein [Pelagicoccus sp. NFK12]|uniref:DUF1772 domain-containing protein n=1 Tax=Pelagicoccus enzymogenes TaxID=2773457 RepID=A0A927IJ74_9BACT|nr:anthrone oxygenase family protein [Pelagicoccus enzymogenes]MBD5782041.1 DUF1772 domain-containing protein [Pelagicoccus enzymogenes]MDQ8196796.1 DUF1772 domain-containing protein [Pelagicoccus enzymogenes]